MLHKPSNLLFSGGLIFDGNQLLEGHSVLINNGQIERVAASVEFQGFTGQQVDISGQTLLPGLIDCHVHLCGGSEADPGTAMDKLGPGEVAIRALENAQKSLLGGITAGL